MTTFLRATLVFILASFLGQAGAAGGSVELTGSQSQNTFDLIVRTQITINRPAKEVWGHFIDFEKWMTEARFKSLEGLPDQEGEVRWVTSAKAPSAEGYFIKTVRMTPGEQYVVKVNPDKNADFFGYADFSFAEVDGKTRLTYDIYVEYKVACKSEEECGQLIRVAYEQSRKRASENNERLKVLVETRQ